MASRARYAGKGGSPDVIRWAVLAWLVCYVSFDHATRVHVAVARAAEHVLPLAGELDPVGLLVAGTAAVVAVPLWRRTGTGADRLLAAASAALVVLGGWGADILASAAGYEGDLGALAVEAAVFWAGLLISVHLLVLPRTWRFDDQPAEDAGREPMAAVPDFADE
jgi:hypothetical protein